MAAKKDVALAINPLTLGHVEFTIRGTSPLIVHAWSEKAKREMIDKQTGKKVTSKHDIKVPLNDYKNSLYWLTEMPSDGKDDADAEAKINEAFANNPKFGFPCNGIKASIISGAYRAGLDVKMVELKGTLFLKGNTKHSTIDNAEIVGPLPELREDMVRVGGMSKSADIRYRAEFKEWEIPLELTYIKDGKYSLQQILNLVNFGGYVTGIGEWRPEKDGQFGMYELDTSSVVVID